MSDFAYFCRHKSRSHQPAERAAKRLFEVFNKNQKEMVARDRTGASAELAGFMPAIQLPREAR